MARGSHGSHATHALPDVCKLSHHLPLYGIQVFWFPIVRVGIQQLYDRDGRPRLLVAMRRLALLLLLLLLI